MSSGISLDADVLVVGVGTMGSFAMWQLARRGVRVIGFDRFQPGHDRGSGHGGSRIIRTAYFEGSHYVPLLQAVFPMWRELEREAAADLLTLTGALAIGRPESALVMGTLHSARRHGLAYEILERRQAARRYPQHRLLPGEVVVHEKDAGVLRPENAIRAAAGRAEQLGATLLCNTPVDAIEVGQRVVEVQAGGRTYRAAHVIVSVGAWLGKLLPWLALPLSVERQVMTWFTSSKPNFFAPECFPVFIRDHRNAEWYGFPTLDGATVKVAMHHLGQSVDPDDLDREVHGDDLEGVRGLVRRFLPDLDPAPVRSQVCMYTNTPDQHFLVGHPPGMGNLTVLGGFSGHGFKFAPIIGAISADLALHGRTEHPVAAFSLDRFGSGSGS